MLFDKFHRGRPARHSEAMRNATTDDELLEDADVSPVGLGLYLARNVMEQMGGRITVESEVGRGTHSACTCRCGVTEAAAAEFTLFRSLNSELRRICYVNPSYV
jgi:signal transduction histidine kinase